MDYPISHYQLIVSIRTLLVESYYNKDRDDKMQKEINGALDSCSFDNIYGYIYLIENKVNNKKYFGQTTLAFNRRYSGGRWWEKTHNTHLKSSIKKYGIDNFTVNERYAVAYSKEDLDELEDYFINKYKTTDSRYGYNKKSGGAYGKHTLESRIKMSNAHLGQEMSSDKREEVSSKLKGRTLSEDHKLKISEANRSKEVKTKVVIRPSTSGENNPQYGISPRERMDEKTYSEWRSKLGHKNKDNCTFKGNVMGISLTECKVIVLKTANQGKKFGFDNSHISKCCKGNKIQYKGYKWKYINKPNKKSE